jgi:hypothetical protein
MSRVVYENTPATAAQEALRAEHRVRLVDAAEEGSGVNALPAGIYGFTYSPGLPNAPLFATRRYRSYETHKLASGEIFLVGFVTADTARQFDSAITDLNIQVQPEPDQDAMTLVKVPYSRIRHHRQYAAPNQHGFSVTLKPLRELVGR